MAHILVAGKLHPSGLAILNSTPGITYDYVEEVSESSYAGLIHKADALVLRTQPLSSDTVDRAGQLKVVSRHGVGYDAVHLPSLNERGIALAVVGDVNSMAVAEHAMMLLLTVIRRTVEANEAVRSGNWGWRNTQRVQELANKNLLILGYGRIGRLLARMARSFDMDVRAYDPFLSSKGWPQGEVRACEDLRQGLAWADAVSINVPKVDKPLLTADELAFMKPSAILVNTARGGIVEEAALIEALRNGQIAAAGLDVFDEEPPSANNPLLGLKNVVLTPHVAALAVEGAERLAVNSVRNAIDYLHGTLDPALLINAEHLAGYMTTSPV